MRGRLSFSDEDNHSAVPEAVTHRELFAPSGTRPEDKQTPSGHPTRDRAQTATAEPSASTITGRSPKGIASRVVAPARS